MGCDVMTRGVGGTSWPVSFDECASKRRQSGLGLRRIGEKTITVIMFNGQRRRIEVMQLVLHGMGEAHLQYQHEKADR